MASYSRGDLMNLQGYEPVAYINAYATAEIVCVVHNNSSHYIVAVMPMPLTAEAPAIGDIWTSRTDAEFVRSFPYGEETLVPYHKALACAVAEALSRE